MASPRAATEQDHRERILRVLVHLQEHLDEALDIEALAKVARLSPFHFHRVFRALVGETAMEHVRRLRLERAARQLKASEDPVVQVAFAAGYEAHEAFTRAFAARFGVPPIEYRRQRRGSGVDPAEAAGAALSGRPREPSTPVEIRPLSATRIAFARHVGPFTAVGEAWRRLYAFARERGLSPLGAFGLGHDDPEITPPERYRYDACLPVGPEVAAEGSIGAQVVRAGRFAVALHRGPYEALGETYGYLLAVWLPRTGRAAAQGPSIERYLDDPMQTRPEDLRTEVWIRLEEAEEEAP
jgi:AraC family transcriptional regulator